MTNHRLTAGFAILAILLLFGCSQQQEKSGGQPKTPPEHLVEVVTVEHRAVSTAHQRTGTLRARRTVRIHNQEEGKITKVPFYEGDRVKQGDIVIAMADDLLRAELDKAQATSQQASIDLKRLRELVKKRAISEDEVARAQTAMDVAQAEKKLLETRLGYTRIAAPFNGVVSERHIEPGDVVARHTHLLTLTDPESLVTELHVSELLLPHIATGDPVNVIIDALGNQTYSGRVLRIHPDLDPITRQGIVEIILDPVPEGARSGQFARITLTTAEVERALIPFGSVQHDRDGEFVYLMDGDLKARRRAVRSGIRIADKIEILSGLESGEQVISRGFLGLTLDKLVKPVNTSTN
ncbi:MAG: efflux transporter periplasmic adaptor subunit [Sedimenticola sp.]|jgi:RND family efflux transporter MFP subunit|nr:MAG: efflux transporter periplasmic adaptor subunit [Sedimenticola sp.]